MGQKKRILGVLAGKSMPFQSLADLATGADFVFAADSGQDVCLAAGFRPDVVVGDLDSVKERLAEVEYRERIDQNFSDCDKLIAELRELGEVDFVVGGFEGDRFDHVFASLMSFVRGQVPVRLLLGQGHGKILWPGENWGFGSGTFSILPLGDAVVTTMGAQWELQHSPLSFAGGGSLSNEAQGDVLVKVESGCVLVIRDRVGLDWEEISG
jgi:thiamine pyrophosphokinase